MPRPQAPLPILAVSLCIGRPPTLEAVQVEVSELHMHIQMKTIEFNEDINV